MTLTSKLHLHIHRAYCYGFTCGPPRHTNMSKLSYEGILVSFCCLRTLFPPKSDNTSTATLLGYNDEGPGGSNIYSSPHESLFRLWSQSSNTSDGATEERDGSKAKGKHNQTENTGNYDNNGGHSDASVLASWNRSLPRPSDKQDRRTSAIEASTSSDNDSDPRRPQLMLTYAGMGFDSRRMCGPCTVELRRAVISSGHDLELWHTVDHERRGLLTGQRRGDVFKAQWAEHEQQERQVTQAFRFAPREFSTTRRPFAWGM